MILSSTSAVLLGAPANGAGDAVASDTKTLTTSKTLT
jgi:hypothetical protein